MFGVFFFLQERRVVAIVVAAEHIKISSDELCIGDFGRSQRDRLLTTWRLLLAKIMKSQNSDHRRRERGKTRDEPAQGKPGGDRSHV